MPPSDSANTAHVRIFTPGGELPFAGHPTVGTAHVLATTGRVQLSEPQTNIVLEEGVGPVPVTIFSENGRPVFIQLAAAKLPEVGPPPPDVATLSQMLSLSPDDLLGGAFAPETVSCGVPYLLIPLRNRDAVARTRLNLGVWETALRGYVTSNVFVFALDGERDGSDVRARMFAPGIGIAEDPATGSAAVTLGGYLANRDARADGTLRWVVEQGFEMGRPSILQVEADKVDGAVTATRVGGASVIMSEGRMRLPEMG